MFDSWEAANGDRHHVFGRVHGVSPGKYGTFDTRWGFDLGAAGLFVPKMFELVGLAIGVALAQQRVFDEPPESVLSAYGWLEEGRKIETERELVARMQVLSMHWDRHRDDRERRAREARERGEDADRRVSEELAKIVGADEARDLIVPRDDAWPD